MTKIERIFKLHSLLSKSATALSIHSIEKALNCSQKTALQIIKECREYLHAPIRRNKEQNAYFYDRSLKNTYEIPGLWFNASELYAILVSHQLLSEVKPGFLEPHVEPLQKRIKEILDKQNYDHKRVFERVRILKQATRDYSQKHFAIVTTALLNERQLEIQYQDRSQNQLTVRILSPQRLVHYRDNWYLDAWCHKREALRTFSIDCIKATKLKPDASVCIDEQQLEQHFSASYGIFAGEARHTAVLCFSETAARWVANEQWHPLQSGQFELDGRYSLRIPYNDSRELLMDILKYGADVEVIAPPSLRKDVVKRITLLNQLYHINRSAQ